MIHTRLTEQRGFLHRQPTRLSAFACNARCDDEGAIVVVSGRVHLDRRITEPTRELRSKTKIVADGKKPPVWGFDGSSTNQATGKFSDCVLNPVASFADPLRGPKDVLVMCEVLNPDMSPHDTNTRAAALARSPRSSPASSRCSASNRSTRSSKTAPVRLARSGISRAPGSLLLRRWWIENARTRHRRSAHAGLHARGHLDRRHQRRSDDGPVGVPTGHPGHSRDRRPDVGRALAPQAHRRRVRRGRQFRRQAHQGRLERCGSPHQLLDQADPFGRWWPAIIAAPRPWYPGARAHRELRRRHRRAPHRRARDPTTRSSPTASRTAARRCASPARSRARRRATSKTVVPTPTLDPYVVAR
jgi:hypothetical protein